MYTETMRQTFKGAYIFISSFRQIRKKRGRKKKKIKKKNPEVLLKEKLTFSGVPLIYNLVARDVSAHIYQRVFQ